MKWGHLKSCNFFSNVFTLILRNLGRNTGISNSKSWRSPLNSNPGKPEGLFIFLLVMYSGCRRLQHTVSPSQRHHNLIYTCLYSGRRPVRVDLPRLLDTINLGLNQWRPVHGLPSFLRNVEQNCIPWNFLSKLRGGGIQFGEWDPCGSGSVLWGK